MTDGKRPDQADGEQDERERARRAAHKAHSERLEADLWFVRVQSVTEFEPMSFILGGFQNTNGAPPKAEK
jgi:hypothetical protein